MRAAILKSEGNQQAAINKASARKQAAVYPRTSAVLRVRALQGIAASDNAKVALGTSFAWWLPLMEKGNKLVLQLRTQILGSEAPGQADDGSHLVDVLGAMRTAAQVSFEPMAIALRQSIFEVVRDKLDDLLAREGRAATKQGVRSFRTRSRGPRAFGFDLDATEPADSPRW
jgi:hypothetical protein